MSKKISNFKTQMSNLKLKTLNISILFLIILLLLGIGIWLVNKTLPEISQPEVSNEIEKGGLVEEFHPLSIKYMREQEYPGSEITIEQTLPNGYSCSRMYFMERG